VYSLYLDAAIKKIHGPDAEKRFVIVPFTSYIDEDGNDIYEGDIVGGYPHGTVQVRWCKEYACFEAYWKDEEEDKNGESVEVWRTSLFANELDNCKDAWVVLGSIYEHSKLIN